MFSHAEQYENIQKKQNVLDEKSQRISAGVGMSLNGDDAIEKFRLAAKRSSLAFELIGIGVQCIGNGNDLVDVVLVHGRVITRGGDRLDRAQAFFHGQQRSQMNRSGA